MSGVTRAAALACAAALGLGAAGCGGDDEPGSAATTTAAATPTQTLTTEENWVTVETGPTATTGLPKGGGTPEGGGESGEGGAGDEEAARVPVTLTAAGSSLSPTTVTIPAFLAIDVTINATGAPQTVMIGAPGGGTLEVPAGQRASKRLAGLKPGSYLVTTRSGGRAVLRVVSGGDPGP